MKATDLLKLMAGSEAGGGSSVDIGDDVPYSLMLNSASSQYLSKTFTSSGTWTLSVWVKRAKLSAAMGVLEGAGFLFNAGDTITAGGLTTTALFRDPGAWTHVHISNNGLYVGGVSYGAVTTGVLTNPDIGRNSTSYFDGYLADLIFLDNDTVAYTSFGRTSADTGAWVHKDYAGSYTAGSFHLDFADSADLGNDVSGNGNDWTTNGGISSANQYTDTPTNNYPILNFLGSPAYTGTMTIGNTKIAGSTGYTSNMRASVGIPIGTGKWYWEVTCITANGAGSQMGAGVALESANINSAMDIANVWSYSWNANRYRHTSSTETNEASGVTVNANDVICLAFDASTGNLSVRLNSGSWYNSGDPAGTGSISGLSTTGQFHPFTTTISKTVQVNFGQGANMSGVSYDSAAGGYFKYTVPTGYKALSTANLPEPAILKPAEHFDAKIRTGTGASYSVSGLEFQPDLVWVKGRSGATDHAIYDVVRGVQKQLGSNTTTDETTESTGLTAFNSDGYTAGALAQMNTNTATYIDWMWKAGGSGSSNTAGSITSTISVNTTAGISIGTYTASGSNSTIGHGLGVAPKIYAVKARTTAGADQGWAVYHALNTAAPETDYLLLNSTAATADDNTFWNDTAPTSTVFSIGTNAAVNTSGDTYVFIAFAAIEGFSKAFSYTGNASTDGVFVYTGFTPAFAITKCTSTTGSWSMWDLRRPGYNVIGGVLIAENSTAEATTTQVDRCSNGLKFRTTSDPNSAQTFIGFAFAELPFKYSPAR